VQIKTGDILVKHSSGGGGVGSPAERGPELVREDVENGLVSLKATRDVYKVVLNPRTLEIDYTKTKVLRARALAGGGFTRGRRLKRRRSIEGTKGRSGKR